MVTITDVPHTHTRSSWIAIARIALKAAVLFVVLNLAFAVVQPLDALGRLSVYGTLVPSRVRLPYGDDPAAAYSLSIDSLPAMFATHSISQPKAQDEYRVIVLGDSQTWGWLRSPDQTISQITQQNRTLEGRRVVVYNLGYPVLSLMKDLLILDYALQSEPDLIVWIVTLQSFGSDAQLSPLVLRNPERSRRLIADYDLSLDPNDPRFEDRDFFGQTIIGQRRSIADWLRLQLYGFSWWATGIDHAIPDSYTPRATDLADDESWDVFAAPTDISTADLAFDVLDAGVQHAGDVPLVLVNEPIYVSDGANSDVRYNAFYPRWVYDRYRDLLREWINQRDLPTLDLWNAIAPDQFTDTPVHLTAGATTQLANEIANWLEIVVPTMENGSDDV